MKIIVFVFKAVGILTHRQAFGRWSAIQYVLLLSMTGFVTSNSSQAQSVADAAAFLFNLDMYDQGVTTDPNGDVIYSAVKVPRPNSISSNFSMELRVAVRSDPDDDGLPLQTYMPTKIFAYVADAKDCICSVIQKSAATPQDVHQIISGTDGGADETSQDDEAISKSYRATAFLFNNVILADSEVKTDTDSEALGAVLGIPITADQVVVTLHGQDPVVCVLHNEAYWKKSFNGVGPVSAFVKLIQSNLVTDKTEPDCRKEYSLTIPKDKLQRLVDVMRYLYQGNNAPCVSAVRKGF